MDGTKKPKAKKQSRVMDVAKPGKTAPSASSRPIITGHAPPVKDPMVNEDKKMSEGESEEHKIDVKRSSPKVIAPLTSAEKLATGNGDDDQVDPSKDTATPDATSTTSESPESSADSTVPDTTTPDPAAEDTEASDTEAAVTDQTSTAPAESDTGKSSSGSKDKGTSIVDAVAGQAAKNKEGKDSKKDEEMQKRLAAIEKMVDEKKYFVHTSSTTQKTRKTRWAVLLLAVLLLAGAYLAIDAQAVKNDYWLPYHFFKEDVDKSGRDSKANQEADDKQDSTDSGKAEDDASEADKSTETVSAQSRAQDTERKNDLKNLQQKLEMYFNENGNYPAETSWVTDIGATNDEVTDPEGAKYSYTSPDQKVYVLKAQLENPKDDEADASGNYVLHSID